MLETPSTVDVNSLIQTLSTASDDDETDSGTSSTITPQYYRITRYVGCRYLAIDIINICQHMVVCQIIIFDGFNI